MKLLAQVFLCLTLVGCSDDDNENTFVPASHTLKSVVETSFKSEGDFATFNFVAANTQQHFDEQQGTYLPDSEGCTLQMTLCTASQAVDVTRPQLAEGKYTLAEQEGENVWLKNGSKFAMLDAMGNLRIFTPESGEATVDIDGDFTDIQVNFSDGVSQYEAHIRANMKFESDIVINKFQLKEVGMTQFAAGELHNYMMMLATEPVIFDEENFVYRTEKAGLNMIISLYADNSGSTQQPVIPEGVYQLSETPAPSVWSKVEGENFVIETLEDGSFTQMIPQSGSLTVKHSKDGYQLTFSFTSPEGTHYKVSYNGAINFEGIADEGNILQDPVDTKFIGGQIMYRGQDEFFPEYSYMIVELYDAKPDPELGTVQGNLVKCKLYMEPHNYDNGKFTPPVGTYEVGMNVSPFIAEPGLDDGVNIPTGSYIAQTAGPSLKLGMFSEGTITITDDFKVQIDVVTDRGVSVKGTMDIPCEIFDYAGGGGVPQPGGPYSSIKEDKVLDVSNVQEALFLDYGDYFKNGTRNVVLQFFDEKTLQGMLIDCILPAADRWAPLPECTITALTDNNPVANTYIPGIINNGATIGTWAYLQLVPHGNQFMIGDEFANACSGTFKITPAGDTYTIEMNVQDDQNPAHTITTKWTGKLKPFEYQTAASASITRWNRLSGIKMMK